MHLDKAIYSRTRESLLQGARPGPEDLDGIHAFDVPQAGVGARVVAAQAALTRLERALPAARAGYGTDFGADGVAFERGINGADRQPVAAFGRHVVEDACLAADRRNQQIQGAVVV